MDEYDMTEEQKIEFLHDLAAIMQSFVDQAFGIDPVQLSLKEASKKNLQSPDKTIDSKNNKLTKKFSSQTAGKKKARKTPGK